MSGGWQEGIRQHRADANARIEEEKLAVKLRQEMVEKEDFCNFLVEEDRKQEFIV